MSKKVKINKIENYGSVGSIKERHEIKDAYVKCKGNIRSVLKYIPCTDNKSKKRITYIIKKMIKNGEVVKFSSTPKTTKKKTIDGGKEHESSGSVSTHSQKTEHIIPNTQDNLLRSTASSTPIPASNVITNKFPNLSHVGFQDILQIYPGIMNNSMSTSSGENLPLKLDSKISLDKTTTFATCSKPPIGTTPSQITNIKVEKKEIINSEKRLLFIKELFLGYAQILPDTEKNTISTFNNMDTKYQCVCLELLTTKDNWYRILKFSKNIRPDMEDRETFDMATVFEEKGIIDTNYENEQLVLLLNQLTVTELTEIINDIETENKRKSKEKLNKKQMIENICSNCITPSKISLLKQKILNRMGKRMKVNTQFKNIFYSAYLQGTFTNPRFLKIGDYLKSKMDGITFPKYPIDKYTIFTSTNDFVSYSKAKIYRNEFDRLSQDVNELFCDKIFNELRATETDRNNSEQLKKVLHLTQFSARAVYVGILSDAADKLVSKYPHHAKRWLKYMLDTAKDEFPHEIGRWYNALIQYHFETFDYDQATEILMEALDEAKHMSDVQLHVIYETGRKLSRKNGIVTMNKDRILQKLPKRIASFPERNLDAKPGESNEDYGMGDDVILATFTLFFYDIIYSPTKYIAGAFVSAIQSEPLDMNTRYFYSNRRVEIEQRLREIESEWPDEKVVHFVKKMYEEHNDEFGVCNIEDIIKDSKKLANLVQMVGRKILAKIYKRLAVNFVEHKRGFPDLLVWNEYEKKNYFVVIKRTNEKLSIEQILWLDYLRSVGAEVSIYRLSKGIFKKKIQKIESSKLQEASTSSAPDKIP